MFSRSKCWITAIGPGCGHAERDGVRKQFWCCYQRLSKCNQEVKPTGTWWTLNFYQCIFCWISMCTWQKDSCFMLFSSKFCKSFCSVHSQPQSWTSSGGIHVCSWKNNLRRSALVTATQTISLWKFRQQVLASAGFMHIDSAFALTHFDTSTTFFPRSLHFRGRKESCHAICGDSTDIRCQETETSQLSVPGGRSRDSTAGRTAARSAKATSLSCWAADVVICCSWLCVKPRSPLDLLGWFHLQAGTQCKLCGVVVHNLPSSIGPFSSTSRMFWCSLISATHASSDPLHHQSR